MGRSKKNDGVKRIVPASTPEARENQLISLAYDRAAEQIADGTASSQVLTHFLKMGSSREKYEREIAELRKELLKAKTEAYQSSKRVEEMYLNAIEAMREYSGHSDEEMDDYED